MYGQLLLIVSILFYNLCAKKLQKRNKEPLLMHFVVSNKYLQDLRLTHHCSEWTRDRYFTEILI